MREVGRNTLWVQLDKKVQQELDSNITEESRNTLWVQLDKKLVLAKNEPFDMVMSQYSMSAIR